jgi:putative nucleotidyltransferase with HDIG domain
MLGHLAEAAAEAIGADALLARVSGYYHDIGKTKMPDYFIENQPKGYNRHDRLEPSMSALIIAAHVKEGVEMANKARLPEPIVTAIREHHGTKLIRYFYQKAVTKAGPGQVIAETEYHPGPRPSHILGILMIADAVRRRPHPARAHAREDSRHGSKSRTTACGTASSTTAIDDAPVDRGGRLVTPSARFSSPHRLSRLRLQPRTVGRRTPERRPRLAPGDRMMVEVQAAVAGRRAGLVRRCWARGE